MAKNNLGLANKVNKKYQGPDLDKRIDQAIEDIGKGYIHLIRWNQFALNVLSACADGGIQVLKKEEHKRPDSIKFKNNGRANYMDMLPPFEYCICRVVEDNKKKNYIQYGYSKDIRNLNFVKEDEIVKECVLEVNHYPDDSGKINICLCYNKYKNGYTVDSAVWYGPILEDAPIKHIEDLEKRGMTEGTMISCTNTSVLLYEVCQETMKSVIEFILALHAISEKAQKKYSKTRLSGESFFSFLIKELPSKFVPKLDNGETKYEYKFWDSIIEESKRYKGIDLDHHHLGLANKISKKFQDKKENIIDEMAVLDIDSFAEMLQKRFKDDPNIQFVSGLQKAPEAHGSFAYQTIKFSEEVLKKPIHRDTPGKIIYVKYSDDLDKFYCYFCVSDPKEAADSGLGLYGVEFPQGNLYMMNNWADKNSLEIEKSKKRAVFFELTIHNIEKLKNFLDFYADNENCRWFDKGWVLSNCTKKTINEDFGLGLGLNSKIKEKHGSKSIETSVEEIAETSDRETFFEWCAEVFSPKKCPYILQSVKGITNEKNGWDFWYLNIKPEYNIKGTAYIKYVYIPTENGKCDFFEFYFAIYFKDHDCTIEFSYPTGNRYSYWNWIKTSVDELDGLSDEEIFNICLASQYNKPTYGNLLKAKKFLEDAIEGKFGTNYIDKDSKIWKQAISRFPIMTEASHSLGLSNKVVKSHKDKNTEDQAIEISEISFVDFFEEVREMFYSLRDKYDGGNVRWYPETIDPTSPKRQYGKDENWISVSFKDVGRFVCVLKSQLQNYPKYKNLLEDTFRLYYGYVLNPERNVYESREVQFSQGSEPIDNPDSSIEKFYKMTYKNLDLAKRWMEKEITTKKNVKKRVQMD